MQFLSSQTGKVEVVWSSPGHQCSKSSCSHPHSLVNICQNMLLFLVFPVQEGQCTGGCWCWCPWLLELLGEQIPAHVSVLFPWGWCSQEGGSAGSCLKAELPLCCPGWWVDDGGHIPEGWQKASAMSSSLSAPMAQHSLGTPIRSARSGCFIPDVISQGPQPCTGLQSPWGSQERRKMPGNFPGISSIPLCQLGGSAGLL